MQADTCNTSRFQSSALPCQPSLHRLQAGSAQHTCLPRESPPPTEGQDWEERWPCRLPAN